MITLDPNTTIEFKDITGYDLNSYLQAFNVFQTNYYPSITDFYSGKTSVVPKEALKILSRLKIESANISSLFTSYKQALNKLSFWFLVDFLDDISIQILSMTKIAKYYRASVSIAGYGAANEFNYSLNDRETLENVESKILKSNNPNQDWVQLALRNDLRESDYDINDAGNNLVIFKPVDVEDFSLQSVVDVLTGEKFYGRDINKKITFVDDEKDASCQDLKVLDYKDTFMQAVDILISITKGSIPEYPTLGISGWIGSNLNMFNFKSFIRQISQVFQTDDTILGFAVNNVSYSGGAVSIEYQANSFYNLVYISNTQVT